MYLLFAYWAARTVRPWGERTRTVEAWWGRVGGARTITSGHPLVMVRAAPTLPHQTSTVRARSLPISNIYTYGL